MSPENLKLAAYVALVSAAEKQPFYKTTDGSIVRGIVARLVWARIQAQEEGLVTEEIRAAIQIGEYHNQSKANPPLDTQDYFPYDTEEYWEAVYREAGDFWARRGGGKKETE